jgi:hypothetical protein
MFKITPTFYDSRFFNYQNADGTENDSHSKRGKARHHFNWVGDLVSHNHALPLDFRPDLFLGKYHPAGYGVCLV